MTALAAEVEPPVISDLKIYYTDGELSAGLEFNIIVPDSAKSMDGFYLVDEASFDGGEWEGIGFDGDNKENGIRRTYPTTLNADTVVKYRVRYQYLVGVDYYFSPWSNVLTLNGKIDLNASDWAKSELEKADALGLIPDSLKGADLTKPITRAEFAAVSVKAYEALSGTAAIPAVNNPFTDTKDVEVLKAYNVGITAGTAEDKFSPDVLLNREQAAVMLTRVFKKVSVAGWTLATDGDFPLDYAKPAAFADDAKISDWAKPSVYFMVANGIISGVGDNNFAPKATTSDEEARGYAQATREQALVIAVRMVEKLGA
ncbi:MAG: S-layer homology domain-containing protein [Clostridiales bacterium]|nr:S-layer homology domain-containing protein [Clostridiales bacterium]